MAALFVGVIMTTQAVEDRNPDDALDGQVIRDQVVPGGDIYYSADDVYSSQFPDNPIEQTPAQEPTQTPVETPPAAPTTPAAPPQPAQPTEMEQNYARVQAENAQYQHTIAQHEQATQRTQLQTQAQQYRAQLEQRGYQPEHATEVANERLQMSLKMIETQQRHVSDRTNDAAKNTVAQGFASMFGVSYNDLIRYDSPQAMEAYARGQKDIRDLQSQVTQMKQGQVPTQQFNQPAGAPATTNRNSRLDALNSKAQLTDADLTEMAKLGGYAS